MLGFYTYNSYTYNNNSYTYNYNSKYIYNVNIV